MKPNAPGAFFSKSRFQTSGFFSNPELQHVAGPWVPRSGLRFAPRAARDAGAQSPVAIGAIAAPLAPASPVMIAWAGLFALNPATEIVMSSPTGS